MHLFFDAVTDDAFARTMRQRGTFVIPTMSTFDCGVSAEELLADPRVSSLLSAAQLRALNNRFPVCDPRVREVGAQNIRRLNAAGVPIIAGTDAGATLAAHGASMMGELTHLVRGGLTPAQALTAATATPSHPIPPLPPRRPRPHPPRLPRRPPPRQRKPHHRHHRRP